jgi:uncharacterized protein (TIGR03435 family)
LATALPAQTPPAIDVASIRVIRPGSAGGAPEISGNRLTRGGNVNQLVMYAWNLKAYQIAGGPAWVTNPSVESDYYDISVVAEGAESLTPATARLLMQDVLTERFHLSVHREQREMPVYALVRGKSGPKLKESAADATCKSAAKVTLATVSDNFMGCTMDFLMRVLAGAADRPVLDRTGLTGAYDFKLEFARDPLNSDAPALSTAVQEQLGLKLEPQNAPIEITVMDRVERPSPN